MKKGSLRRVLLGFGILLVMATSSLASGVITKSAQANTIAPEFTLTDVDGQTVSLKDYHGKGVILFFFTTWCPHCQEQFPMLISSYQALQNDGFDLLAIDAGESATKAKSYTQRQNVPFKVLVDSATEVTKAYGIMGVPTFLLVDKDGLVVFEGHALPENYRSLLTK
jgi:peroxiredoxin